MYERFTDRARKVMALANHQAQHGECGYIGPEHILLGLIKEGSGVGANVLKNLDLDFGKVRRAVEGLQDQRPHQQPGQQPGQPEKLDQTDEARHVIEHAIEEARALNHPYVGTEHLLLGLIRDEHTIPGQIFAIFGVTPERVRQEILKLLGGRANQEQISMLQEEATNVKNAMILNLLCEIRDGQKAHYEEWKRELAIVKKENKEAQKKMSRRANLTFIIAIVIIVLMWISILLPSCIYRFLPRQHYSYLDGQEHQEARQWLADNANPSPLASNRFGEKENAAAFVEQLYRAGAQAVYAVNITDDPETLRDEGGPYSDSLVMVLPEEKEKREKLFALAAEEAHREGFDNQGDYGQEELFLWWD